MRPRALRLFLAGLLLAGLLTGWGCGVSSQGNGSRTNSSLERLTADQRLGQMLMVGFEGTSLTPEVEQLIRTVQPGGVILFGRNIEGAEQLRALIAGLQELSREANGLPLLVAIDQEGGEIVRAKWLDDGVSEKGVTDASRAYDIGLARARGLKGLGVNLNLAPVLDLVATGDFLDKYGRGFQGGPERVGELGAGVISGQREGGIFSTAKHFPGYGGITFDPENDTLPVMAELPVIRQFQVAAEAEPELVMTANVVYEPIDSSLPFPLTPAGIAYLHEQVPGDYLVISDDLATKVLKEAFTLESTVTLAASAGVDLLLVAGHEASDVRAAFEALRAALSSGALSMEQIDRAAGKILALKAALD